MKKLLILALGLLLFLSLFGNEMREFRFIEELYQRDNLSFARDEIARFRDKYPQSDYLSKADYYEAMIDFLQNNYTQADQKLLKLVVNSDQEIKALVILALVQTKFFLEDYVASEKYANKFLQDYSNHKNRSQAYYWKGRIALERGNLDDAQINLDLATRTEESSMLNYLAFQIKLKQNKISEAKTLLDSTFTRYSDEFTNQIILEWFDYLYQKLDYKSIVADSNYTIPSYSRLHSDYAIILGQAYYQLQRYDDALRILRTIQPTTESKQFHIALAYKAKGDHNLASSIFKELAQSASQTKIKELSFFEMINSSIALPQGNDTEKKEIVDRNKTYLAQLSSFISENPTSNYLGNAYYLQGFILYLNEDYEQALNWLLQANNSKIDNDTREKLLFLIGDIYFSSVQKNKAISFFEYYQELYPKGRYDDEVLYKIALTYFDSGVFSQANDSFLMLAKEYPKYKHISTAYFYLGEINVINNNLQVALEWFQMALKNATDPTSIWMRIAEVNYLTGEWQKTFNALSNIPDSPLYSFRVNLIKGNIYYNLKDYDKAIQHYQLASNQAVKSEDISLITSRLGWTYYLKGDFQLAERTFRTLSNFSSSSEDYLILAGNSALNGKRYHDAINLFQEFLLTYPVSTKTNYVKLNLGDSYYNLKQYQDAFTCYSDILNNNPNSKELKNSLLGLKWTVLNDKNKDYRSDLATLANKINNDIISQTLAQITLLYENETAKWDDVIKTAETLLQNYPQDRENKVINQTLARAYSEKKQYDKADSLYANLTNWHNDSELFSAWSQAFLARRDTLRAIEVLNDALTNSQEIDIWFKNLELKVAYNDSTFVDSYQEFISTAQGLSKIYAELLLSEWKLINRQTTDLNFIQKNADSSDDRIASQSYYLLGLDSFLKEDYDNTALNMMRVIYLFPEYSELNIKASYYLILAQYYIGDKDKAQQNFDIYHSKLAKWQSDYLRKKIFK